jgi:hypothetical protein
MAMAYEVSGVSSLNTPWSSRYAIPTRHHSPFCSFYKGIVAHFRRHVKAGGAKIRFGAIHEIAKTAKVEECLFAFLV